MKLLALAASMLAFAASATNARVVPIAYTSAVIVNHFHVTTGHTHAQAAAPIAAEVRISVAAVPGAATYAARLYCPANVAGRQDETLARTGIAASAESTFAIAVATHSRYGNEAETQACWLRVAITGVDAEDVDVHWLPVSVTHRRAYRY